MRKSNRLPTRFPEGTKYVLESRGGVVHRFVEFPDGRRITLNKRKAATCACADDDVSIVPPAIAAAKRARRPARVLEAV